MPTKKRIPTTEKLAKALEEKNDPKLEGMIKKAREGFYHDFNLTMGSTILQLHTELSEAGYPDLADRVRNGDFDARRWEWEEWYHSKGQSLLRDSSLMRGKGKEPKTV